LSEIHPQQTSEQLPPNFSERLHSSDGEAPWNDRHGRRADVQHGSRPPSRKATSSEQSSNLKAAKHRTSHTIGLDKKPSRPCASSSTTIARPIAIRSATAASIF
jgi:hypothetical protein